MIVIVGLAASLAAATIIESKTDMRTGRYWVYETYWFYSILALLGVNIVVVALSRWPWKRRHAAFLLAHTGIVLILVGSLVTKRFGIDGTLRIREGELKNTLELEETLLVVQDGDRRVVKEIPWTPPNVSFKPIVIPEYGLEVARFLTHAEPKFEFSAAPKESPDAAPALKLKLSGGPMRAQEEFWLWGGDPSWSDQRMGPARFVLLPQGMELGAHPVEPGRAMVELKVESSGALAYRAVSIKGTEKRGKIPLSRVKDHPIDAGWSAVKLEAIDYYPRAMNTTRFEPSMIEYGDRAPPQAIQLRTGQPGREGEVWMGLGEQAILRLNGREVMLAFIPRRVMLPFSLKLERFQIDHYEGTQSPSSYSSQVVVVDVGASQQPVEVSMNEPLHWGGYTFYQASYVPEDPRPKTSVFSVNRDPGRALKYIGSILLVLGSILLFVQKHLQAKQKNPSAAATGGASL